MDLVPELPPRLGIDARGRLIEQEKLRIGERAGTEREALLPAAGKLASKLLLAAGKPEPLDHLARRLRRVRKPENARDEFQVLAYRKVLIQAEMLRHVTHVTLDLACISADVET